MKPSLLCVRGREGVRTNMEPIAKRELEDNGAKAKLNQFVTIAYELEQEWTSVLNPGYPFQRSFEEVVSNLAQWNETVQNPAILVPKGMRTERVTSVSKPTKNDRTKTYTYAEYVTWDGPERWELVDGMPYMMASPTPEHQQVLLQLSIEIGGFLRGKPCRAYMAPMDLTFEGDEQTKNVVQPDLFVMCGEYGRDKRIIGVPVLVVEVLSPSTATTDLIRKLNLYGRVGVKEYWIVEPEDQIIHVYLHDGTLLRWTTEYKPGDTLKPTMFADMEINVKTVFAE